MIRINKYLARCGVTSRRNADTLVTERRVLVNDKIIDTPGFKVDETVDEVKVDGVVVKPPAEYKYIILNKPAGYVTSLSDPHHTRTVADLVSAVSERVYPIGRLDQDTEGVLLFTNDGEMAHRLTHPRYGIKRLYRAHVKREVADSTLAEFSKGIELPDGAVGRAQVSVERRGGGTSDLIVELTEGRKREVKHLCKAVGHPVVKLRRLEFAGITCGRLKPGQWRELTEREVSQLQKLVGL